MGALFEAMKTFRWILCSSLFLAATAFTQEPVKRVSLTMKAADAVKVVKKLEELIGQTLFVDGAVRREILLLRVDNVPVAELLKRIAKVAGAEWVRREDGLHLVRSDALARQQQREEIARKAELIRKQLAEARKAIGDDVTPAAAEAWAKRMIQMADQRDLQNGLVDSSLAQEKMAMGAPAGRLLLDILAGFPAEEIASVPINIPRTYATTPTKVQSRLPATALAAIQKFGGHYKTWTDAIEMVRGERHQGDIFSPGSIYQLYGQSFEGQLGKVLLVIRRDPRVGMIHATVKIANSEGKFLGSHTLRLLRERSVMPVSVFAGAASIGEDIEFSEEAKQILKEMDAAVKRVAAPSRSRRFVEKMLRPEELDPLSFVVSDVILGMGKAKKLSVVACLPDSAYDDIQYAALASVLNTDSAYRAIAQNQHCTVLEIDGWLEITPYWPVEARIIRLDRLELGKLLRVSHANGYFALDDLGAFTQSTPLDAFSRIAALSLSCAVPEDSGAIINTWFPLIRMYGGLEKADRQSLELGGKLYFSRMTPSQRREAEKAVYGYTLNLFTTSGAELSPAYDLAAEPTEYLPDGIVGPGYLSLSVANTLAADGYYPWGDVWPTSAEGVAFSLFWKGRPEMSGEPQFTTFKVINRKGLQFHVRSREDAELVGAIEERSRKKGDQAAPFERLPKDFQDLVNKELAKIRKNHGDEGGGGGPQS
jgi:hypothetical protein